MYWDDDEYSRRKLIADAGCGIDGIDLFQSEAWKRRIARARADIAAYSGEVELRQRAAALTDEQVFDAWRLIDQWAK